MKYNQIFFCAVYGALLACIVIAPSYPLAIALLITAALYVFTFKPEVKTEMSEMLELAKKVAEMINDMSEVKGKLSQLSLSVGLKNLKKEN